jgi:phosphofructokinase-like protein
MMKTIGILTSGGDCAGLNTVLKSVTDRAVLHYGWRVLGIRYSTLGLMGHKPDVMELTPSFFDSPLARMGGTLLGTTNKGDPFHFPMPDGTFKDRTPEILEACRGLKIEGMIGVGGDGSLRILYDVMKKGPVPFVGIPKTIDNDLGATESSIGYATAVEVATEALDRLQPTAASHDRVMILEVMGRDAGHIAVAAGIAGGADIIIIPEIAYHFDAIVDKIKQIFARGRTYALIIVAEAVKTEEGQASQITYAGTGQQRYGGIGHYFADRISTLTGAETRFVVLGHVQRGAQPNAADRILASAFGVKAVDCIAEGQVNSVVAWQHRQIKALPIEEALSTYQSVQSDDILVQTARGLGVSFGDTITP